MQEGTIAGMSEAEFSDYCHEVSANYWAEEEEMKAGIHPTQVKERIEHVLGEMGYLYEDISYLDWSPEGPRVKVDTNGSYFGIFNYSTNEFEVVSLQKMTGKHIGITGCKKNMEVKR